MQGNPTADPLGLAGAPRLQALLAATERAAESHQAANAANARTNGLFPQSTSPSPGEPRRAIVAPSTLPESRRSEASSVPQLDPQMLALMGSLLRTPPGNNTSSSGVNNISNVNNATGGSSLSAVLRANRANGAASNHFAASDDNAEARRQEARQLLRDELLRMLMERAQERATQQQEAGNGLTDTPPATNPTATETNAQDTPTTPAAGRERMLTPARLRSESLVAHMYFFSNVAYAMFCVMLLDKLRPFGSTTDEGTEEESNLTWWETFVLLFIGTFILIPVRIVQLFRRDQAILLQIGPSPSPAASTGLHLQFSTMRMVRMRSYICDHTAALVECLCFLATELIFASMLDQGKLGVWPLRLVFTPLWVSWVAGSLLNFYKYPVDRFSLRIRDGLHLFLLMLALKVDGLASYSWTISFFFPFVWFATCFLLAFLLSISLIWDRVWARTQLMLLPFGFWGFLVAQVPLFVAMLKLIAWLNDRDGRDDAAVSILAPAIAGFGLMGVGMLVVAEGLRQKETIRRGLLASGSVWTNEAVSRGAGTLMDREAAERRADTMTDEELAETVRGMMDGKVLPQRLKRVGQTLYARCAVDEDDEQSKQQDKDGMSEASMVLGSTGSPPTIELAPMHASSAHHTEGQHTQARQGGENGQGSASQMPDSTASGLLCPHLHIYSGAAEIGCSSRGGGIMKEGKTAVVMKEHRTAVLLLRVVLPHKHTGIMMAKTVV